MITYDAALSILFAAKQTNIMHIPLNEASGYVAAQHITSSVQVPPFANSAMDGFAVRAQDIRDACEAAPVTLPIIASSFAGDAPAFGSGGAWEIATGAPLAAGYDSVVKSEDVTVQDKTVTFTAPIEAGSHIRIAGGDFAVGDDIIRTGTQLTPYHIMALAALGQDTVSVYSKPNITLFSTGKELVDDANTPLKPGQIRNANMPYLMSALKDMGYMRHYGGLIADAPAEFEHRLKQALPHADIIMSTGAVSAGKHDFIPRSVQNCGGIIHFHKVAIRPGKPILYAQFPNGTHYFGLPGNPISAAIGLRFFIIPLLRHMQAMTQETPLRAQLQTPAHKKQGFRFFRKAYIHVTPDGKLHVHINHGQESHKIHPMLKANGWAILTEAQDKINAGEAINIYPLMPHKWAFDAVS